MIVITLKLMQITDAFGCKGGEGGCPVLIHSLLGNPPNPPWEEIGTLGMPRLNSL